MIDNTNIPENMQTEGTEREPETLLIITRALTNPSGTMGTLATTDGTLILFTHEGRIPADRRSYVSWCLRPGKYRAHVEKCVCLFRGVNVPGYWLFFDRIHNFPKACITADERASNKYGIIKIGDEKVNDYHLTAFDDANKAFILWCKGVFERIGTATFCVEIIQNEDALQCSDMDEMQYKEYEYEQEVERHRQSLIAELYGEAKLIIDN